MFENSALSRIFRPKVDKVTEEWRKLHNVELNKLYSSSNMWVIKSRRLGWARRVACMGGDKSCIQSCGGQT